MTKVAQASSSETFGKFGQPGNQRRTDQGEDGELFINILYKNLITNKGV